MIPVKVECNVGEIPLQLSSKDYCVPCSGSLRVDGEEVFCILPGGVEEEATLIPASRGVNPLLVVGVLSLLGLALFGKDGVRRWRRKRVVDNGGVLK